MISSLKPSAACYIFNLVTIYSLWPKLYPYWFLIETSVHFSSPRLTYPDTNPDQNIPNYSKLPVFSKSEDKCIHAYQQTTAFAAYHSLVF